MNNIFDIIIPVRRAVYMTLGFFDRKIFKLKNPVFIISYHSIANDDWRFSVNEKEIKKQITYLKKHFEIITLLTLHEFLQEKKRLPNLRSF